ncbi:MAG TPA: hypothetical protein VFU07_05370 [Candidatus Lumbricidophila sp.]|nr:hypothetical protein [Candidatus Lumbricidophila sp.]
MTTTPNNDTPEPLPTVPGLYAARDDLALVGTHDIDVFKLSSTGVWSRTSMGFNGRNHTYDAIVAHENRGGLVRLVPAETDCNIVSVADAPRFSDEELDLLREVVDIAEFGRASTALIAQARRILGLVPAEGSAK